MKCSKLFYGLAFERREIYEKKSCDENPGNLHIEGLQRGQQQEDSTLN